MASPQTANGFIRIANELYDEILRRNFSKRQQNIVLFIWRLSYGTGKKACCIPKNNYFELAGIDKTDIKKELDFLKECQVILIDQDEKIYSIRKDFEKWQITPNKRWSKDRLKELVKLNIEHKKVGKIPTLEGEGYKQDSLQNTNFKKCSLQNTNLAVGKIQTKRLVKYQLLKRARLRGGKAQGVPKDIERHIKDINNNNINNNSLSEVGKIPTKDPFTFYSENFEMHIPPATIQKIQAWIDDLGDDMVLLAMDKTLEQEQYKHKFHYVNRILVNWHKNKIKTPADVEAADARYYSKQDSFSKSKAGNDEIVPEWFKNRKNKPAEGNKEHVDDISDEEMKEMLRKISSKK